MAVTSLAYPKYTFVDANGKPLAGGLVYTYQAGTSTLATTWTDSSGSTANTNPVVLDVNGQCTIWGLTTQTYDFGVHNSGDVLQYTVQNISGAASYATFSAYSGSSLVGFLQAGTGAVARTAQAKMRDFVSAKDFGAVGDNVTDDTAAIQKAIDAVHAAGGGGVYLTGKYKITSGLQLKFAVTLWGIAGQAERTSVADNSAAGLYCTGTGYDAITIGTTSDDAQQAGVIGISIFNAPQAGIVVKSHAATIRDSAVTKCLGSGIILNSGSGPTLIDNTHVIQPGKHGIEVYGGDHRIVNSEIQQPNYSGAGLTANTYDCIYISGTGPLQVINCRMGDDGYRSRAAVYVDYSAGSFGGLQLVGNDFQNFTIAGLWFAAGTIFSCNVIGNRFITGSSNANLSAIRNDVVLNEFTCVGNTFNATVTGGQAALYFNAALTNSIIRANTSRGNWGTVAAFHKWTTAADRDTSSDGGTWLDGLNGSSKAPSASGRTLTGATPSVNCGASADVLWLNNAAATNVTDFLNGYTGQEITLFAVNGNTTIVNASNKIRLLNNEDWTMPIYSVLRLKKAASTFTLGAIWYEIGRSTGGAAAASPQGISVGGNTLIFSGTGTPEGAVAATVGCMYLRKDGGTSTTLYVKESGTGNTGWVAK